jgi:hypothetical protein
MLLCALLRTLLKVQLAADPPSNHAQLLLRMQHIDNSNLLLWMAGKHLATRQQRGSN